ncbi:MAG: BadF/BadG/BcrA/BcrD ATPase family protein [Methyloceanibacter sp.]
MSKPFFIGIDGGATSCRARIRDMDGSLLGEGESGPANIHSNFRLALQSIRLACEAALRSAALDEKTLQHSHAGLGLAGAGIKSACDRLLSEKMPFASMMLETDAYAAWLGAHHGGDGAIVILGTGSCGLALINDRRIGVAGWGADVSDEAGGQRMGREALRRTLWAFDGRTEETALSAAILDRFGGDPAKIVRFASRATPALYAELAPLVLQYASLRDPLAITLVQETADAAVAIIDRLADAGAPAISLVGGLAEPLLPWLPPRIRDLVTKPQSDALDGSILMARRAFFRLDSVRLRAG